MKEFTNALLRKCWRYLPLGCFVAAILCLCFSYGVAVGKWHLFPYRFLDTGLDSLRKLRDKTLDYRFHPARYEDEGIIRHEFEQVSPGVTLMSGLWKNKDDDWNLGIRLIDINGNLVHHWWTNPKDIWPESPHSDCFSGSRDKWLANPCIHGALLLPGGDVVFNLDYVGLVRLNTQSEVVWKLPYRTHHSIFQDADGKLWICGAKWHADRVAEFPGMEPPFRDDIILRVSQDGIIDHEISVLRIIYESEFYNLLFATGRTTGDILHMNDVEVLSEQKEDAFDLFNAGDIMISLRHSYAILVIDGKTNRIKWSMTYPFIDQHDPDFTDDGYITVFDNNLDQFGGSRILSIEPSKKLVEVQYGHKENQYFFTFRCGKHQHLPNGNMLITEAWAGRVFEINANGEVVWSWIMPRRKNNTVPEMLEGIRYGVEYASFASKLRKDEK